MTIQTKTTAQFVTAVEDGTLLDILAALKKPGADRIVMVVRVQDASAAQGLRGLEVWDVG